MHDCVIWRHMSSSLRLRASVTAVAFGRSKGIRQRSKTDLIIIVRSRSECVSLIFNLPISEVVALRCVAVHGRDVAERESRSQSLIRVATRVEEM